MSKVFTTTVRLNLDNEEDAQAYRYLQTLDKRKYRSYSKAMVAALNFYFDRQEQLTADPYLETREKEDAFLERIEQTIRHSLQGNAPTNLVGLLQLLQGASPAAVPATEQNSEDISAALNFADSF